MGEQAPGGTDQPRDAQGRMGEQAPKAPTSLGEQAPEVLTSPRSAQ